MNKKAAAIVGGILVLGLGVFGFTKLNSGSQNQQTQQEQSAEQTTVQITDANGEKAELKKNPKRVVVFDYGVADILKNLGVDAVVGLPKNGKMPEILSNYSDDKYTNVGSLKETDMEKVYELKPDLIIMSGRLESYYEELNKIAPTIYLGVDNTDYLGSFKKNMETLGQIFGKEKEVKAQVAKVEEAIGKVNEKAEGVNALIALANDNAFSVYGEGSRFGIIHNSFGVIPVDDTIEVSTHGQKASFEYVLEKNPQYLFVVDRAAIAGGTTSAKELFENELMAKTDAYKNDNIVYLDPAIWYTSTGGFTSTMMMIEEIDKAIN